jgi:hypothetical protein
MATSDGNIPKATFASNRFPLKSIRQRFAKPTRIWVSIMYPCRVKGGDKPGHRTAGAVPSGAE